jgi:hypothetical protein
VPCRSPTSGLQAVRPEHERAGEGGGAARPVVYRGQQSRAIRIGDPADVALLQAIARGEFATAGFRNRDFAPLLYPKPRPLSEADARRRSARIGRLIRLLRAHGLVRKVPKSHRYLLTESGHQLSAALFAVREAPIKKLLAA